MKKGLILLVIIIAAAIVFVATRSNSSEPMSDTGNPTTTGATGAPRVVLNTNYGAIEIELLTNEAPQTAANFLKLAGEGFYDSTLFHRVIPQFMIQGGDPLTKQFPDDWARHGTGGPGYAFDDEANTVPLEAGVVAMANSGVRNGKGTNGSQFFIVTASKIDWLNVPGGGYHTPFGRVVSGMDTVSKIEQVRRNENDHPLEPVRIEKVEVK
jgi:cyclophilin family peptidyl-prolyl cis-trans isomerase